MVRRCLAVVVAVSLALVAPVARASEAQVEPLPSDATLLVPGHGWGHGRGMGQWGAYGMAKDGATHAQILTHYYSDIRIGTRDPHEPIRVLVESSPDVVVTSDAPFTVSWGNGPAIATSGSDFPFYRARYDGSVYKVERAAAWNGPWSHVGQSSSYVQFKRTTTLLQLVFNNGVVRYYRGQLEARYAPHDGLRSINELTMQEYLYGSVPRESPASWPIESLKAQSVAARTYAAYKKDYSRSRSYMFDICATTACQVYLGYASKHSIDGSRTMLEHENSSRAVDETAGTVLLYNGAPILAEYSSSTGGHTAPGNVPYQKPVPDPTDAVSPYHDWQGKLTVADVLARYPQLGALVDVVETERNGYGDWGGRVRKLQLVGTSSTVTISGWTWQSVYGAKGVRSDWFDVRYWRGTIVSAPSSLTVAQGDDATIVVHVRNTGSAPWAIGGPVRITTPGESPFASPAWVTPTRPAAVTKNVTNPSKDVVATGEVAEFRISMSTASKQPGAYTQAFGLSADGASVMKGAFTVSLEILPSWTEEAPNMLSNASFEGSLGPWTSSGLGSGDGVSKLAQRDGPTALRLAAGTKRVSQRIDFAGGTARRFVLGGWNRTTGNSGAVQLRARARYTDGTSSETRLDFYRRPHPWTYDEVAFTTAADKRLDAITVTAYAIRQSGDAYFDAIRLVESPVLNPSFEDGISGWAPTGLTSDDGAVADVARDGARSLLLAGPGSKSVAQAIPMSGRRTERFVLSAWTKSVGTDPNGGDVAAVLTFVAADGTTATSPLRFTKAPHEWEYAEIVARAPFDFTSASITLSRELQTGEVWFDNVRVIRAWNANPSFEDGVEDWTTYGFSEDDGVTTAVARGGAASLRLSGPGKQGAYQGIPLSSGPGRPLIVTGWTRSAGTNPRGGFVGLTLGFRNHDGTTSWRSVPFSRDAHDWTFVERAIEAPKSFRRVDVYALFYDQTGWMAFDGITLRSV